MMDECLQSLLVYYDLHPSHQKKKKLLLHSCILCLIFNEIYNTSYKFQNFKHIMKELQGAVIIASAFQAILGYSGLMSVLLRYGFLPLH